MKRKITIIVEDGENVNDGFSRFPDNGWVDGIDVCANCPNRPGGPNKKSGFCNCAIPSMYGPNRVTC